MSFIHGGRLVAQALAREGVSHLFTLCGGHIQHIYDGCLDEGIRVVDVRHEQTAGHAAEGWARATGQVGVAAVTAGPGVTDAVTAAANAWRSGVPMVLIGGQGPTFLRGKGSLQEMDHVALLRSVTRWADTVPETGRIPDYLATAFRKATTGVPGPVFLEIPLDVLMNMVRSESVEWPVGHRSRFVPAADPAGVEDAASLLAAAERPVAIVGSQWFFSPYRDAIADFVGHFDLPAYLNGAARGALAPSDPRFFRLSRARALSQADAVAIFGTPWDFRLGYGAGVAASAKVVQVDLDPEVIGHNRGADVGLHADTGLAMRQLVQAAPAARHPAWLAGVRALEQAQVDAMRAELASDAVPINPLRFSAEVAAALPEDVTIVCDGGDIVGTAAKVLEVHRPGHWMDPGPLGTLGVGPGFAMAARLARPESPVVVIYGDGSFGLHAMEFEAMVRQGIPVVGVIGNDACWTQIHRGQCDLFGKDRCPATRLGTTRYDRVVEALGGHGEFVERPDQLRPAVERALASGRPAVVNAATGRSDFRKGAISV